MNGGAAAALRAVLPAGVGLGQGDGPGPLWPGEALPGAAPARLAEFATGRAAARAAMMAAALVPAAVPMGADRAPVWPPGVLGSISHARGLCLALAGNAAVWDGIGLDIEPAVPLDPDLWPEILRTDERAALAGRDAGLHALRVFTAKEAAYKAQYAQSATLFGFETLQVTLTDHGFTARFTVDVPPFAEGALMTGLHVRSGDHLIAVVLIPRGC